jgi:hypothetical protein
LDRIGPRLGVLIAALALLAAAKPFATAFPIQAARWLKPSDRLKGLSERPVECATPLPSTSQRALFEIGRTAFRTPVLLGGQAARSGLACEACHTNGRRNVAFSFPALSGDPGTADVTSSIMSSHRGNGRFDPRPIPDLARPARVSRDRDSRALEAFIDGLIEEEFDGAQPSALILNGLGEYVRAIGTAAKCDSDHEPVTLAAAVDDVSRATAAAGCAWKRGDPAAANLLLSGARAMLGGIDERYQEPQLATQRDALALADIELAGIQRAIERRAPDIDLRLAAWQAAVPRWSHVLRAKEKRSLYNPARLAKALSESDR